MSAVERCSECGLLFGVLPRGVCADCIDKREGEFRTVRDWLRRNGVAPIAVVARETGVDDHRIVRFVREGRIEMRMPGDPALVHEREEEERRAELVRKLADAPRLGTSVNAEAAARPTPDGAQGQRSKGMRARRN